MNKDDELALRLRAEEILATRGDNSRLLDKSIRQIIDELDIHQIELEIQNENLIKHQQELLSSHTKYSDLYHLSPIAYFTLNNDGLIVDVNQAGLELLGIKKASLLNRSFSLYVSPEFQLLFAQLRMTSMRDKLALEFETKLQKWSGPSFYATVKCKLIQNTYNEENHFLICATDISNKKNAEKAMQSQRAKIAAIDRVRSMNEQIYMLTRNQNHLLGVMSNYMSGCVRRLESEKFDRRELLDIMRKAMLQSQELANYISEVGELSSRSVFSYEYININTIIIDCISLLNSEEDDYVVTIQYESVDRIPLVKIDKLHIQQVILSLARNAIEAMKDAKIQLPKILIEVRMMTKKEIIVSVFDNGPGFPPNSLQQIFETNFTTKSYALGLGLATSRTIIESHGGSLIARNNPQGGAILEFTLPCIVTEKPKLGLTLREPIG